MPETFWQSIRSIGKILHQILQGINTEISEPFGKKEDRRLFWNIGMSTFANHVTDQMRGCSMNI